MKTIKKFWGLALVVILLSSLLVVATPASAADPLRWETKLDAPSGLFSVLSATNEVRDYAVNGAVMYACSANIVQGTSALMQSVMGGAMWTNISAKAWLAIPAMDFAHVAIAPDDPNVIVVSNNFTVAAITIDGGTTFTSMGTIQDAGAAVFPTTINKVSISPKLSSGVRYIVVSGQGTGGVAGIWYYNYGSGVGAWKEASLDFNLGLGTPMTGQDTIWDFEFSPNFASDLMAAAVSSNISGAAGDNMSLQMLNFNLLGTWNTEPGFPVTFFVSAGAGMAIAAADLNLAPDYDGSDESTRVAFVGTSVMDTTQKGGVFRFLNTNVAQIYGSATAGQSVNSVAYDGTNLAVGDFADNNVYHSDAPLSSSPTFLAARSNKRIGIDVVGFNDRVKLLFVGETLYGAKLGVTSALSKSIDYGNVWNDYTLMDSALTVTGDLYMGATGNPWYISATDANAASIYQIANGAVTRVLCVPVTAPAQILRLDGIASDSNILYATDVEATGASAIYYTADGGQERWFARTNLPTALIADVAVESATTMYLGQAGTNTIYKSINKAFSWGVAIDTKLGAGNAIYDIESIGEGQLVIGGTFGGVCFSTDGAASFTQTLGVLNGGFPFPPVAVAASGLTPDAWIFAAPTNSNVIWRAPAAFFAEFKSMGNMPVTYGAETTKGIALIDGVLYTTSDNGSAANGVNIINSTLVPTTTEALHTTAMWRTAVATGETNLFGAPIGFLSNRAPDAMKATSDGSVITLYSLSQVSGTTRYYMDNVALGTPALIGPADMYLVQIVSPLTGAISQVNFTWSRLSLSTNYQIQIALDSAFDELLINNAAVASALDPVSIIYGGAFFQPGVTYYWRVRSNIPLTSQWSETREFTTQPSAASVPAIASPTNGSIVTGTPAFSWAPVAGATMYRFELDTGTAFTAPLYSVDSAVAGAQLPASVKLVAGKTYFWRVKSLSPVESDWSSVANFVVAEPEVAPPPPTAAPTPTFTVTMPPVTTQVITVPPAQPPDQVNPTYIWAIIIIGAILVIAVIVLIVRTRRSV